MLGTSESRQTIRFVAEIAMRTPLASGAIVKMRVAVIVLTWQRSLQSTLDDLDIRIMVSMCGLAAQFPAMVQSAGPGLTFNWPWDSYDKDERNFDECRRVDLAF